MAYFYGVMFEYDPDYRTSFSHAYDDILDKDVLNQDYIIKSDRPLHTIADIKQFLRDECAPIPEEGWVSDLIDCVYPSTVYYACDFYEISKEKYCELLGFETWEI